VHIRLQQRTGKKCITTIQGLDPYVENDKKKLERFISFVKKQLACNGSVLANETWGNVIQLTGDQRHAMVDFLITHFSIKKELIKLHGF
jgi:translation initiation factor 1